jgi:hypothetical protein
MTKIVPDKFMRAVLAALNESTELVESDWNPTEAAPDEPVGTVEAGPPGAGLEGSEIRFAATVSSCMAKIRSGTPEE